MTRALSEQGTITPILPRTPIASGFGQAPFHCLEFGEADSALGEASPTSVRISDSSNVYAMLDDGGRLAVHSAFIHSWLVSKLLFPWCESLEAPTVPRLQC